MTARIPGKAVHDGHFYTPGFPSGTINMMGEHIHGQLEAWEMYMNDRHVEGSGGRTFLGS